MSNSLVSSSLGLGVKNLQKYKYLNEEISEIVKHQQMKQVRSQSNADDSIATNINSMQSNYNINEVGIMAGTMQELRKN